MPFSRSTSHGMHTHARSRVPFSVVSDIIGWSASTAVRMAKQYGHIGHSARRDAVDKLSNATVFDTEVAKKYGGRGFLSRFSKSMNKNGSSGRTRIYNPPVNSRRIKLGAHVHSMT